MLYNKIKDKNKFFDDCLASSKLDKHSFVCLMVDVEYMVGTNDAVNQELAEHVVSLLQSFAGKAPLKNYSNTKSLVIYSLLLGLEFLQTFYIDENTKIVLSYLDKVKPGYSIEIPNSMYWVYLQPNLVSVPRVAENLEMENYNEYQQFIEDFVSWYKSK